MRGDLRKWLHTAIPLAAPFFICLVAVFKKFAPGDCGKREGVATERNWFPESHPAAVF